MERFVLGCHDFRGTLSHKKQREIKGLVRFSKASGRHAMMGWWWAPTNCRRWKICGTGCPTFTTLGKLSSQLWQLKSFPSVRLLQSVGVASHHKQHNFSIIARWPDASLNLIDSHLCDYVPWKSWQPRTKLSVALHQTHFYRACTHISS